MTGATNKIGSVSWELGHTAFNASTLLGGSLRENYNASGGKVIAIGQLLEIHPTWSYAQAEARARELFYTNAALHELGHALAGIGDSEDAEGVMSYANFKIGNPAAFLTLLPLPDNFLSAIKALLCD